MNAGSTLPFAERAAFIAGPAKSGTTLLVALLDSHPELLVFPQETAYFPTVLTKYGPRGRRAQFDYLTRESLANVLFGGPPKWGKHEYTDFPHAELLQTFEQNAFDPANVGKDLLVLLIESYAAVMNVPLARIKRWVEKTPANRNYVDAIFARFSHAKLLLTLRDPRALLAAQIALEKTRRTRRFSAYYVVAHWGTAAKLAQRIRAGAVPGLLVQYEDLVREPAVTMRRVCDYLEVSFEPDVVLTPTKAGGAWSGNSATRAGFSGISDEPAVRWERELTQDEIGWIEWHCRDLMPEFGYELRLDDRQIGYFVKPIRGERPREYIKSRFYSIRDQWVNR
jgi:Sulfotransferase family